MKFKRCYIILFCYNDPILCVHRKTTAERHKLPGVRAQNCAKITLFHTLFEFFITSNSTLIWFVRFVFSILINWKNWFIAWNHKILSHNFRKIVWMFFFSLKIENLWNKTIMYYIMLGSPHGLLSEKQCLTIRSQIDRKEQIAGSIRCEMLRNDDFINKRFSSFYWKFASFICRKCSLERYFGEKITCAGHKSIRLKESSQELHKNRVKKYVNIWIYLIISN